MSACPDDETLVDYAEHRLHEAARAARHGEAEEGRVLARPFIERVRHPLNAGAGAPSRP